MNEQRISELVKDLLKEMTPTQSISIEVLDGETLVFYEHYEHEPIINENSTFSQMRRAKRGPKSPETKEKIRQSMTGKSHSFLHKMRLSEAKKRYYRGLRDDMSKK